MEKVSLIISSRNSGNLLKASLPNLSEIKTKYYENMEVIVVDNTSTDGSVELINKNFPWVKLVQTKSLGLSAANNLGAKQADGKYLLFMSADSFPRVDTIEGMVDYLEKNQNVGVATPRLSLASGKADRDGHRHFPTPWNSFTRLTGLNELFPKSKFFNSYFMGYENLNNAHEIDACVFGFMLMPNEVFRKVGGFDDAYIAFGEDIDICYRVKQLGFKVMFLPQWESGYLKTELYVKFLPLKDRLDLAHNSTAAMRTFLKKNYKHKYSPVLIDFMILATYLLEAQRVLGSLLKYTLRFN